jgi:HlyD family secretion protein
MKYKRYLLPALCVIFLGCKNNEEQADAYGNFEAIEVIVSAEAQGRIVEFKPREGELLLKDQVVVVVDSTQLNLKKTQLQSGIASLRSKINTIDAQVRASKVQLENLEREKNRIDKLFEGGAATSKQQDDMNGQIALLKAQIVAAESQKASVHAERKTLEVQIDQVEDQIRKCAVRNPMDGIMLTKYKEAGEITVPGQSLYKMANMDELFLRAYVSGEQLSKIETGQSVKVRFDIPGGMEETSGVVSWISPQAEFTPKIIQTREERINLVYAIKVLVPNDGSLKIGMPGEVVFL